MFSQVTKSLRRGAKASESTLTRPLSCLLSEDFLLSFILGTTGPAGAAAANNDETDESKTAMVCVIVLGFISKTPAARKRRVLLDVASL